MAPGHGQPPARQAQASPGQQGLGAKLGLAWPHTLRGHVASLTLSLSDQDPPERETLGRGPGNRFQGLVWHRVPGGGGRLWE